MTIGTILFLCWLLPCIGTIPYAGRTIYRLPRKPVSPGSLRGGNPRSATVLGVIFGIEWPLFLCLGIVALFCAWCTAGGSDA